jgi:hypothetical protein
MRKFALAAAILTAMNGSVTAQNTPSKAAGAAIVAKEPTSQAECLALLRDLAPAIDAGKYSETAVAKSRPMGRAMSTYCKAERYKDAFETYNKMVAILNAK